ncbi:nuclease A inhibitor family protein [Nostoc sp. UHCC 0302]|uniref:nuclease A inhibitor family protein n=1 Tax=Nostoc sp. UHCC 0302 TaxID=3134896 RepID=UPI00311CAAB0
MSNSDSELLIIFKKAAHGLFMLSESEHPFIPFIWSIPAQEDLNFKKILELTNHPQDLQIETIELDYLFRNCIQEKDWHDEQQKRNVVKYRELVETIKSHLTDIKVYRIGSINIDVYIVGKTEEGNLAGLETKVVET